MKTKHKVYFLFILFISGLFMVPILNESPSLAAENGIVNESTISGVMPREIRVAIYDEPDFTPPTYATEPGSIHNNVTQIAALLSGAGYSVDLLGVQEISDYQLKTTNYDVFIMCDNFPRDNITDHVMNFWNGGGGILAFDGSSGFLCYFGILPPEAVGTDGRGVYWEYAGNDIVIMERHPVTKSYHGGTILTGSGNLVWDFPVLLATSIGADITKLASSSVDINDAAALAFEPSDGGGKVVTMAHDLYNDAIGDLGDMIVDAVDWLAPRPKGRVLFDLTHDPYYGVDAGEPVGYYYEDRYADFRDELVSKTFTFDKLYPAETPYLTSDILENYDMLVINCPDTAYTSEEITVIQSWVEDGGGLLLMGDWTTSFADENANLRAIMAGYDMNITETEYSQTSTITTNITMHLIGEAIGTLDFEGGNYLESWGDAHPIALNQTGVDELAVAQEIGQGRVVLLGDINILSNYFATNDNTRFGFNIANWLCSGGANILLFTDGQASFGPDYNFYKSPAALALNELGVNYFMTNERDYFNESLKLQSWDLLIIDSNNYAPATSHSLIRDHIEAGGRVIWRDFLFRQSQYDEMWNYLGWKGLDNTIQANPPRVYLWDAGHSIFNMPVSYGADNITSSTNLFNTDYANVTIFENATAIAGVSVSPNENATAIILSHGDRVLCNMMAISEYLDDTDDSTYADGYELFINEIAFMLRPTVNHPTDMEYTEGETGNEIVWQGNSELPFDYIVELDEMMVHSAEWNGGSVTYNVDGLTNGTYVFEIILLDDVGYSVSDSVTVTVLPYVAPTNTTTPTGGGGAPLDSTLLIIIAGAAGAVVIIIIIIVMKKK